MSKIKYFFFVMLLTIITFSAASTEVPQSKNVNMTTTYVKEIGKMSYFWAWPMVNMHNRYLAATKNTETGLQGGTIAVAPVNHLAMFHDYADPLARLIACPNQDVVYGQSMMFLDKEPVIIQVPDFKGRFWVYQLANQRTDSIADLGSVYNSKPGFYMIAGPGWKGTVPKEVIKVFYSDTKIVFGAPRVFMNDTPEDKKEVQKYTNQIDFYPLSEFNGKMKTRSWADLPSLPEAAGQNGKEEVKWVDPNNFVNDLTAVLEGVPALSGEEAFYGNMKEVLEAVKNNPELKNAFIQGAVEAEKDLVSPLFNFRNYGTKLKDNWSTINNGAAFGTDYYTRTAAAKSNIFVNKLKEAAYYYQDLDVNGKRLNGNNNYTITFSKDQIPPVNGFWSITMYNSSHFFVQNTIGRYSLGTKNKTLKYNKDGSLTLYVQSSKPSEDKVSNWLPAPKNEDFSLYIRAYGAKSEIIDGKWNPPAVIMVK